MAAMSPKAKKSSRAPARPHVRWLIAGMLTPRPKFAAPNVVPVLDAIVFAPHDVISGIDNAVFVVVAGWRQIPNR